MVEMVLAAFVIGVTGVVVMQAVRQSTAHVAVTRVEALARGLAGDVLERLAGPPSSTGPVLTRVIEQMLDQPQPWQVLIDQDASLSHGFPRHELEKLLEPADVKILIHREAFRHPTLTETEDLFLYRVSANWVDDVGPGSEARRKEVTFARLVQQ